MDLLEQIEDKSTRIKTLSKLKNFKISSFLGKLSSWIDKDKDRYNEYLASDVSSFLESKKSEENVIQFLKTLQERFGKKKDDTVSTETKRLYINKFLSQFAKIAKQYCKDVKEQGSVSIEQKNGETKTISLCDHYFTTLMRKLTDKWQQVKNHDNFVKVYTDVLKPFLIDLEQNSVKGMKEKIEFGTVGIDSFVDTIFHHPLSYSIDKEDTPWTYTFRPNILELSPGLTENIFRCIHKDCNVTFIGQPNKRLDAAIYLHLWKDHDKQQCIFRTKKVKSKIGDMYSLNEVYNPEEKKWF